MADNYEVVKIPMSEIYSDADFNCRGTIVPIDVIDLAKSIKEFGLQSPITLQPFKHPSDPTIKWRIIAGHRRHIAFRVNKYEEIPAFIKKDLDEMSARLLNLTENLKRENLNILQEAKAIKPFVDFGWTEEMIVQKTGTSRGWVQIRKMLLGLPEQIQKEAAAGIVTQAQIRQLYSMKTPEEQFAAVRLIKDRKDRGEKAVLHVVKPIKPHEKKKRDEFEVAALQDIIQDQVGNNIITRVLGWVGGHVTQYEIHVALREHFGEGYKIPKEISRD